MARPNPAERAAIEERRRRVAALYLRGSTQQAIAAEVGVDQATISRDVAAVREEWRQERLDDVDELTTAELARIDHLEREAWAAWERSRLVKRKRTSREKSGAVEVDKVAEQRDGDPRFLDKISWCISERCKILGLYSPSKVAVTNPRGDQEAAFIRSALAHEDTRELLARLSDSLGGLDGPPGPLPESLR